ncbi:hypothetical protein PanWU01x14_359490 [Parasponia andersonii]|uniref:Uncharacterized protein n=1 Tax=Parasponia andersonii TaxID=3476 RepID=A0A2P5A7Z3_PARAD|nr:hypothetical protein PanWU01x14_359490 [Parasponia andersonii]
MIAKEVCVVEPWSKAVMNNALHWTGTSSEFEKKNLTIVTFDLVDEVFHDIKFPRDHQDCRNQLIFTCHRSSLLGVP